LYCFIALDGGTSDIAGVIVAGFILAGFINNLYDTVQHAHPTPPPIIPHATFLSQSLGRIAPAIIPATTTPTAHHLSDFRKSEFVKIAAYLLKSANPERFITWFKMSVPTLVII
jgi:hypothetical protein